jgi:hypothetical protein
MAGNTCFMINHNIKTAFIELKVEYFAIGQQKD